MFQNNLNEKLLIILYWRLTAFFETMVGYLHTKGGRVFVTKSHCDIACILQWYWQRPMSLVISIYHLYFTNGGQSCTSHCKNKTTLIYLNPFPMVGPFRVISILANWRQHHNLHNKWEIIFLDLCDADWVTRVILCIKLKNSFQLWLHTKFFTSRKYIFLVQLRMDGMSKVYCNEKSTVKFLELWKIQWISTVISVLTEHRLPLRYKRHISQCHREALNTTYSFYMIIKIVYNLKLQALLFFPCVNFTRNVTNIDIFLM